VSALAEPPISVEDLFVESVFRGYSLRSMDASDPLVAQRRGVFYRNLGLTEEPHDTDAFRWFGLSKNGTTHLVGAFHFRPDRSIEVTDFYPEPTRRGVEAGYILLNLLKILVDRKIIPYFIGGIVAVNHFGRRHVEKFFNIQPTAIVYKYDGEPCRQE
jgi:hypothetical protein